jgi:hypothetical protein
MRQNCVKNVSPPYQTVTKFSLFKREADRILRIGSGSYAPEQMRVMEFQVCRRGRARWVVMLGDSVYGAYLDKEQALLDAVDAAHDALQSGREAQVWVMDRSNAARVF